MAREHYRVCVGKDHLIFSCGHFISYEGDRCERLHGHNYRASVELEGGLDGNWYLFDFIALKRLARAITDELDHHMLLATLNPYIRVEADARKVRVAHHDKEWVFPREDCILLPIENTTAELLAKYLGGRLLESLQNECRFAPDSLCVEVEETVVQSASYVWRRA